MPTFEVFESEKFLADLEEAAFWLYTHNLEQSEDFADRKFEELQTEVNNLKEHLMQTPAMGKEDQVLGLHNFPLYEGKFKATWLIDEKRKVVILLEFIDSKYPKQLRGFSTDF